MKRIDRRRRYKYLKKLEKDTETGIQSELRWPEQSWDAHDLNVVPTEFIKKINKINSQNLKLSTINKIKFRLIYNIIRNYKIIMHNEGASVPHHHEQQKGWGFLLCTCNIHYRKSSVLIIYINIKFTEHVTLFEEQKNEKECLQSLHYIYIKNNSNYIIALDEDSL